MIIGHRNQSSFILLIIRIIIRVLIQFNRHTKITATISFRFFSIQRQVIDMR